MRWVEKLAIVFLVICGVFAGFGLHMRQTEALAQAGPNAAMQQKITAAITGGLNWLKGQQGVNGEWTVTGGSESVGLTALVTLAFLNNGTALTDAAVTNALTYITSKVGRDGRISGNPGHAVYDTSLAILPLAALEKTAWGKDRGYAAIIASAKKFILASQNARGGSASGVCALLGGWGYGSPPDPDWADLSNTQFAAMALDAARLARGNAAWGNIQAFVGRCKNTDGGFRYQPCYTDPYNQGNSYGSMTAAAIWTLRLAGLGKNNADVQAAEGWLKANYAVKLNPKIGATWLHYYLLTLSKALMMQGYGKNALFGGKPWYSDMATFLVKSQQTNGSWVNATYPHEGPIFSTAAAVLAMEVVGTEKVRRLSRVLIKVQSPVNLMVIDPLGRKLGCEGGQERSEIPEGTYSGCYSEPQEIGFPEPEFGSYSYQLTGTGDGAYALSVEVLSSWTGEEETVIDETFSGFIREGETAEGNITLSATEAPITVHIETPLPKAGPIAIKLEWDTTADLDLIVVDPEGYEIYFDEPFSPTGGRLDLDDKCQPASAGGPENIYWETEAPHGIYEVYVWYCEQCQSEGDTEYRVTILVDGNELDGSPFIGTIEEGQEVFVVDFEY